MHIFFILRGRYRARFFKFISSEDFKEKRDCPAALLAPIETIKCTKKVEASQRSRWKKLQGPEKFADFIRKRKIENEKPTIRGIFSWSPIQVLNPPNRA